MKKLVLAMVCAGLALAPGAATAQSVGIRIHWLYFSDAGMQEQVGEFVQYCDGSSFWNGYPTGYSVAGHEDDCGD
jgi:hypothetical protein